MKKALINFVDISKSYGKQMVLDEFNLYVRENEFQKYLDKGYIFGMKEKEV